MTRLAAVLLWLMWFALAMAGLIIRWASRDPRLGGQVPFQLVMLVFATTGSVLVAARPRNPLGWLLLTLAVLDAEDRVGSAVVADLPQLISGSTPVAVAVALTRPLQELTFGLIPIVMLVFPEGRLLSPRWRPAVIAPFALVAIASLAELLAAGPFRAGADLAKPFGFEALVPVVGVLRPLSFLAYIVGMLVGVVSLFRRYRNGSAVQRQQVKWVAASASLVALFFVSLLLLLTVQALFPDALDERLVAPVLQMWNGLSALSLPLAIAVAVLRYRLYDIDVLINRTLVYGVTTGAIAAVFFGVVFVLQALLRPFTSGSELAVAASTLLTVALFQPLRRRVQNAVDRRFYRSRYDAQRTLDAFGTALRDQVDLDSVRAALLGVVDETLRPTHAGVWLRRNDSWTPPA